MFVSIILKETNNIMEEPKEESYYIRGLHDYLTGCGFEVIKIEPTTYKKNKRIDGIVMYRDGETLYTDDYNDLQYLIHWFEPSRKEIIRHSTEFDLND